MAWVGAISTPVQCLVCGQTGHTGRNCPSKGLGKGAAPQYGEGTPQLGDKGCIREKWIQPVEREDSQTMVLDFQDWWKKGNHVILGPGKEDNFILNSQTGDKVNFVGGGPTEITVDSGAEESVCLWEWGE
eukprot:12417513-Karenia_brevis.AAC.1